MFLGRSASNEIQAATGGIWSIPTSLLIGRDGEVRQKYVGLVSKSQLERDIAAVLKK
jgi:hypothetical protein